jgi:hypothetical protein
MGPALLLLVDRDTETEEGRKKGGEEKAGGRFLLSRRRRRSPWPLLLYPRAATLCGWKRKANG